MAIYDFDGWEAAHEQADQAMQRADDIRMAVDLLHEVLDLVDRRTAKVLDRETAAWYIEQIILHLRTTGSDLATALAGTLKAQAHELLTFHDWLAMNLATWCKAARLHFEDGDVVDLFKCAVARAWHLARAVMNGHSKLRQRARAAAHYRDALCQNDPRAKQLADDLFATLDGTVRTSSACENVNSTLRAYLWGRRAFKSRRTAQNWLNLLMLWYNLHVFERGKRKGHIPFDLAGVVVRSPAGEPAADWIEALGYAQAA